MTMEWRRDYEIHVSKQSSSSSSSVSVERVAPSAGKYGIYDHFSAEEAAEGGDSSVVRVVPRFLFGIPFDTIADMYGEDVAQFPVVGVFSDSPK